MGNLHMTSEGLRRLLFSAVFAALLMLACRIPAAAAEEETHVVILATSDMHGNIWGWSYEDNAETDNDGMARLYTYIRQICEEDSAVFLIDGGDDLQGTILTDDIASKHPEDPHPVVAAMNYMGYDAMTLGNHEFDFGVPDMLKMLSTAEYPVLAQNVFDTSGNYLTGAGWTIIERGGVRLAVIGVVTPEVPRLDGNKAGVEDTVFESAAEAVQKAIAEIDGRADIVMVSAHMGLAAQYDEEGGSDSAQKILDMNPEIDVLQVGHLHITVNEKQGNTVIGGVRNAAREAARFDLTLDEDGQITDAEVTIVDMVDYEPSEEIREIPSVSEAHEKAIALAGGGSSEGGNALGTGEASVVLGSTTARFQPENEITGIPEGKLRDTAVIDLILKVELENSGADVASAALFKDTSDLPEGDIYYGNIFDIYKYDNILYRVPVTGRELKDYMEWSACCYNQWSSGDINVSFEPDHPSYLYDMFGGVEYEVNLSKPEGERIENVYFHGEPLSDDQVLTLAVNNYRYASALKAEDMIAGKPEWESSGSVRDMIVEYFAENSPVSPEVDGNWKISGIDLGEEDPRRAELISYINAGLLPVPYEKSYNLADYEDLAAQAEENRETESG